jgi:hypothetical protein
VNKDLLVVGFTLAVFVGGTLALNPVNGAAAALFLGFGAWAFLTYREMEWSTARGRTD